ncbi:MAG: redoxin family protein [Opitutaceae bacterium]
MNRLLLSLFLACTSLAAVSHAQTPTTVPPPGATSTATRPGPKAGDLAPDFTVVGPDGQSLKLSDLRGKLVLIDIWATWCGPCVASMPHNSELAEKFAGNDFVILAVCASDSRANYDSWVQRNASKYKFRTAFDPAGKDGWAQSVFNKEYGVTGFPTLILVGKDGRVVGTTAGGGPGENPHVTRLLAKGGLPIDTSHLPPEDKAAPKSVPMMGKTMAMPSSKPPIAKFGNFEMGSDVPEITTLDRDGKTVKLSDFRGKPVFIAFWTGARAPSADTLELNRTYKDQGLVVWAINVATDRAEFDAWYDSAKDSLTYRATWDPAGKAFMEAQSAMHFGVGMYPSYCMVDAQGKLIGGIIGMGTNVSGWLRGLVVASGLKLTSDDQAKLRQVVEAHRASIGAAGGMTAAAQSKGGDQAAAAARPALLGAGEVAPDFLMKDVDGKDVRLSDFKGKVVVLDFWATWCGPCISSFPHTQEIAARYKDQDVVVLASGTSDTIKAFKEWIPKNQPKYPDMIFTFDPNERGSDSFEQRASSKHYRVSGIPTQFVIGRDGRIAAAIVGNGGAEDARTETALASVGVKVSDEIVAKGKKQLADAAEREKARAAEAAEAVNKPQWRERYGKLAVGESVPDFTAEDSAGAPVVFSALSKGKTTVLTVWNASMGMPKDSIEFLDTMARRYAAEGVQFVGLGSYDGRDGFQAWYAANGAKLSFPVIFDPAGKAPKSDKPINELTPEEKKEFGAKQSEHFSKVIPMAFTGGAMAPIPHTFVIDAQGKFLGFYVGSGPATKESLTNLLLRSGVKVAADDMPKRVFSKEDSKAPLPEAKKERIKIGAMAPDFTSFDLDGKAVKISDFKGKVVVLDFWATWCGPCMTAMPHTQEVAAHYKDQDVVVIGSCTSDGRAAYERWVKANQEKYPDILWTHDKAERAPERASYALYGVSGIPTQIIIDRTGKVVDIVVGYKPGESILDAALAKAGVKVDPALIEKGAADLKNRG